MRSHKIHYFLILLCMLSTGVALKGQSSNPGKASYAQAEKFRKAKNYTEAIAKYDEAIKLEPENYRYHFSEGKCYYSMKDLDNALSKFEATVEYKKDFTIAYTLMAKIYTKKEDFGNAVYYYDMASQYEKDPQKKVSYKMAAVKLLLREGKTSEAQRQLQEAKEYAPGDLNLLYFDAKISNQEGDYENAKQSMLTAVPKLEGQPPAESAKFYYELGYAYNKLGDYQNATKYWEKANFGKYKSLIARERSLNSPAFFYRKAVSYYLSSAYDECRQELDKALELQNNFGAAYILMGKMAKKQGNFNQAIDNFSTAASFENDPKKKAKLMGMLLKMQLDAGDYGGAISSANQVLSVNPQSSSTSYYKALAQYHQGQYSSAIATLEPLLAAATDNGSKAKYSFVIGMCAKNSDTERAKDAFKTAMYGPYKPAAKSELDKLMGKAG